MIVSVIPLLTNPTLVDPLRTTEPGLDLFDVDKVSVKPFVVADGVVVVEDTGTGNFDVKFCFDEPPTEDNDLVTGWFEANEVSCESVYSTFK